MDWLIFLVQNKAQVVSNNYLIVIMYQVLYRCSVLPVLRPSKEDAPDTAPVHDMPIYKVINMISSARSIVFEAYQATGAQE